MARVETYIKQGTLSREDMLNWLGNQEHGAELIFFGVVRNNNNNKHVTGMCFDIHESLAQKALETIAHKAIEHSGETNTHIYIAHAYGKLNIGETCIAIGVSAPHRDAAYKANRYIIEAAKKEIPIWKQEHYADGTTHWLPGHALVA